jgi:hypothetical protein
MKWIAAVAAVVVIVLGVLLWTAMRDEPRAATGPDRVTARTTTDAATTAMPAVRHDARPDQPDGAPGVFTLRSDPFWDRIDAYPRQHLLGFVTDCYKGGQSLKAKLKITYRLSIHNHVVTMRDIQVVDSTLTDPELEACMIRSLESAQFEDKEMPEFLSPDNDPEDLLIRIENLKRFLPEQKDGMK